MIDVRQTLASETLPFDASRYFKDEAAQKRLLMDAFATGHAGYIAAALGTVAKARGMTQIARQANMSRGSLYKALSLEGDPQLTTLLGVLDTMGLGLTIRGKRGKATAVTERA